MIDRKLFRGPRKFARSAEFNSLKRPRPTLVAGAEQLHTGENFSDAVIVIF